MFRLGCKAHSCCYQVLLVPAFLFLVLNGCFNGAANAFTPPSPRSRAVPSPELRMIASFGGGFGSGDSAASTAAALDLLYADQQGARARRASEEKELLERGKRKVRPLKAPKIKAKPIKAGSGFGKASGPAKVNDDRSPRERLGAAQAEMVARDGVLRIDRALSGEAADLLREHVLRERDRAESATSSTDGVGDFDNLSRQLYGVENRRKERCDLLLSLVVDSEGGEGGKTGAVISALDELLGSEGTLLPIYEELVTSEGELYEFASVITNPGADRQQIHPDLPFRVEAPLYVVFLALQDVTEAMGPTTFLLGSHTREAIDAFNDPSTKDNLLLNSDGRLAVLKKGDAVVFDARVLHCGNANDEFQGETRALLNFSFRSPKETGGLGYDGSMRPGYVGAMNLGDVTEALRNYGEGDADPFSKYGDGLIVA